MVLLVGMIERFRKGIREVRIWRENLDYSDCSIFQISQNSVKNSEDKRILTVTDALTKINLLTLV